MICLAVFERTFCILDIYVPKRLLRHIRNLILLLIAGTAGYAIVEHWPLLDALYMTVLTLSTVGYEEVHPLSDTGRIFTILFILSGVSMALYILQDMVQIIVESNPGA